MNVFTKRLKALVSTETFYLLFFAVLSLFSLKWFHNYQFILAGDLSWPLDFARFFEFTSSIWDSSIAPGYPAPRQLASFFPFATYGFLASLAGIDASIFQRIVYVVSFFFSGYGFYLLSREMDLSNIASGIGGLLYMLSPYALLVVWNPTYGTTFPFYAFLPLGLMLFLKYLKSKQVWGISLPLGLLITFLSFLGASYSNPAFFLLYLGGLAWIFFFVVWGEPREFAIQKLKKSILFIVLTFLLNAFWIIPLVMRPNLKIADNTTIGLVDDYKTQYIDSVDVRDALRMTGLWTMFAKQSGGYYYTFSEMWLQPVYIIFSYVPIVLSIAYVLSKKSKHTSFIMFLFVAGVALNAGLRAPSFFENFVEPFYRLPILSRVFRSVFLKLGFLLVIPLGLLVGFFFDSLNISRRTKTVIGGIFISLTLYTAYPFFTGEIIRDHIGGLSGYSITVPEDYYEVASTANAFPRCSRTFVFPIPPGYNYHLEWGKEGYVGAYFLRYLVESPLYYVGNRPRLKEFSESYDINVLKELGVECIIYHRDIYGGVYKDYLTSDVNAFQTNVLGSPDVTRVLDTEHLSLYRLTKGIFRPLFYKELDGNVFDLSSQITKVTPTKYLIKDVEGPGTLVFSESFDPEWKAALKNSNEGHTVPLAPPYQYLGYANAWTLPDEDVSYNIEVAFNPQMYFDLGLLLSFGTLVGLWVIYFRKNLIGQK